MAIPDDPQAPRTELDEPSDAVVEVVGEIDASNSAELEARITKAAATAGSVCLDFERCEFIDSSGLAVVISCARQLRDEGGRLWVTNLRGEVARLFEITGLLLEGSAIGHRETP